MTALLWLSPNPFSPGLSISRCRLPNTLPRYHYCTITYQIPPVYYHYRLVSAIINDGSTAAHGRDYWLTVEVRRLRIAWLFPGSLDLFLIYRRFAAAKRFCSSSAANWDKVWAVTSSVTTAYKKICCWDSGQQQKTQLFVQWKCFIFFSFIAT